MRPASAPKPRADEHCANQHEKHEVCSEDYANEQVHYPEEYTLGCTDCFHGLCEECCQERSSSGTSTLRDATSS